MQSNKVSYTLFSTLVPYNLFYCFREWLIVIFYCFVFYLVLPDCFWEERFFVCVLILYLAYHHLLFLKFYNLEIRIKFKTSFLEEYTFFLP